jgi:DNA-binding NtrC family response regulator
MMQTSALHNVVAQLAAENVPVLISGEPGVGKRSTVSRLCETAVPVGTEVVDFDCALADDFGLAKVMQSAREKATGCVLCLVRVDAMSQSAQRVLLLDLDRTLQSGRVFVVCLANVDLEVEVLAGRFREDLYYKISPFTIRIAPLRHRKEEIVPLADAFLTKYSSMFGRPKPPITNQLLRFLLGHSWPGNLPELENAMRTVAAVGDPKVAVAALSATSETHQKRRSNGDPVSLKQAAKAASSRAERELILSVLAGTNWNRKKAAKQLQISYKALLYKMKQIGVVQGANGHQEVTEG